MHVTRRKPVKKESSFQILHRALLAFPITGWMSIKSCGAGFSQISVMDKWFGSMNHDLAAAASTHAI